MFDLEMFKPGSKIEAGLYLVRKPYTEVLVLMEVTEELITNKDTMIGLFGWNAYPKEWKGYILYGPISKPKVEIPTVRVEDIYCSDMCDYLEKEESIRCSRWICHKYTDRNYLEEGVDYDRYYRPKRCESCLKTIPRKPVVVKDYILKTEPFEAIQWTYENEDAVMKFLEDTYKRIENDKSLVFTDEENRLVKCELGDYVVFSGLHFKAMSRREFESKFVEW